MAKRVHPDRRSRTQFARQHPVVSGRELAELLAPVTPARFVREFWARRSFLVRAPTRRQRFAHLFDRASFDRALQSSVRLDIRATFDRGLTHLPIEGKDVASVFSAGGTICVTGIEKADRRLACYVAALKAQLRYVGVVDVRAYLSPHGGGIDTHFDARIATTLQLSGAKRWRYAAEPAVEAPAIQAIPTAGGAPRYAVGGRSRWEAFAAPDEASFRTSILRPGDVLCLPAGTWHDAEAIGHSFAINVAFNQLSYFDFMTEVLRSRLMARPNWRRSPVPVPMDTDGTALPAELTAEVAEHIAELRSALAELDPAGPVVAHAWRRLITASPAEPAARAKLPPLQVGDRLALSPHGPIMHGFGTAEDETPLVYLYKGNPTVEIALPAEHLTFFTTLLRKKTFLAGSTVRWTQGKTALDWKSVRAVLTELLENHFLVRCAS
jgi:ribosomal protein L16 Arg81 hydroxylase